ncbi:hypothetical protein [Candidatus Allofournierella merdipullorum]|uniref:hypothetical protein n=1 Tax=Candidatus Allofournierella merdipullorum TaxID=2838595 RepID=UPI00374EB024
MGLDTLLGFLGRDAHAGLLFANKSTRVFGFRGISLQNTKKWPDFAGNSPAFTGKSALFGKSGANIL